MILGEFEFMARIFAAFAAGGLIGLERTLHGKPAGFRTYALVALASAVLMIFTSERIEVATLGALPEALRMDPLRMAQGIMTGIGFIGAGVIFKEGLTVHGLTSAATVWVVASLGIVFGSGLWGPAVLGVALTIFALIIMRAIEDRLPFLHVTQLRLRFPRDKAPAEGEIELMLKTAGFSLRETSYRLDPADQLLEYRMVITSRNPDAIGGLARTLTGMPLLRGFEFSPTDE